MKWWQYYSTFNGGASSWYDFNYDGLTNEADLAVIEQYLGTNCLAGQKKAGAVKASSR